MSICEKCGQPKTTKILLLGKETECPIICDCVKQQQKEKELRKKNNKLRELRKDCFYPNDLSNKTFANDDNQNGELTIIAKQYVEDFQEHNKNGKGLLLFGKCDVGKSYIATCIANALIDKELRVRFTNFANISTYLEDWGSKKSYIDHLMTFQVLIIDDLDAERDTQYMQEIVYQIIDTWTASNKPLIVTTNLTREQLLNPGKISNNRIYSRLFEKCIPYEVKGNHRRMAQCVEYTKEFMKGIKLGS